MPLPSLIQINYNLSSTLSKTVDYAYFSMNENDNSRCYTRLDLQASVVFTSLGQGRENLRKNAERKTNCYY